MLSRLESFPVFNSGIDMAFRLLPFAFALLLSGCGDSSPMAGGLLEGPEAAPLSDWTAVGQDDIVQLETHGDEPYSVNLWVIGDGANLWVYRGTSEAQWVDNMKTNPLVRIRIGEVIYPLRAERVSDAQAFARFAQAWDEKYGSSGPKSTNVAEAYLFRLLPRD